MNSRFLVHQYSNQLRIAFRTRARLVCHLVLIISNVEMHKMHGKSPFFRASCIRTETPTKDRKTKGTSSISIFSFRVWTNNFWCAVLESIATQNDNFRCVRKERKKVKKKKKKLASDYRNAYASHRIKKKTRAALHKCSMLRIALKSSKQILSMKILRKFEGKFVR